MSFTTLAANDWAGGTTTADPSTYTPPDTHAWADGTAVGGLDPLNLTGVARSAVYKATNAAGFSNVYVPKSGGTPITYSTSVRAGIKCAFKKGATDDSSFFWALALLATGSGKLYVVGQNGTAGHWQFVSYTAAGSGQSVLETIGSNVAPADGDNIYFLIDPSNNSLNLWVGDTAWNGGAGAATFTHVITGGDPVFSPNTAGLYCYGPDVLTATQGPQWGAASLIQEDPPVLVTGSIAQRGVLTPNNVPVSITGPTGGLSPYSAQPKSAAHSGSYANAGSSVSLSNPGQASGFVDASPTAGNRDYKVAFTDLVPQSIDSNVLTFVVPASNATSSTGVTGEVVIAGSVGAATVGSGGSIGGAFDGDRTTFYRSNASTGGYLSLDAATAVTFTGFDVMPRRGDGTTIFEPRVAGMQFQATNDPTFVSIGYTYTIPTNLQGLYTSYDWHAFTVSPGGTYRYCRLYDPSNRCEVAGFRARASAGTTAQAQPVPPVLTPGSGAGVSSVAFSCATTNAEIHYTTDGTDPRTSGTAVTLTAPWATPATISPTASVTIRAIAFHAGLSSPWSEEAIVGNFRSKKFLPNADWFDSSGRLTEFHNACRVFYKNTEYVFGFGANEANDAVNTKDIPQYYGIQLYTTTDGVNMTYQGCVVDPAASECTRPHVVWNASTHKWVMWTHLGATATPSANFFKVDEADSLLGPWSNITTTLQIPLYSGLTAGNTGNGDFALWQTASGTYCILSTVNDRHCIIAKLTADYHDFSTRGAPVSGTDYLDITGTIGSSREGFAAWYDPIAGKSFIQHGSLNYYDSSSTFGVQQAFSPAGTDPLSGSWTNSTTNPFEGTDPNGTNYNAQMASALVHPAYVEVLGEGDYWNVVTLYSSRSNRIRITRATNALTNHRDASWYYTDLTARFTGVAVAVSPGTQTVAAGGTQQFAAVVTGTGTGTPLQEVVWTCTGGSILNNRLSTDGTWTAPLTRGTYTITGTWADGTVGTATVTVPGVTPPPPVTALNRANSRYTMDHLSNV